MINGRETTILGIRNIVTNDRISVNSEQVRLVDLNSTKSSSVNNSFDDFEASANDAESDLIENKTDYLNSLFSSISNENTEEFFNIDNTNEISEEKVERILEPTGESGFKKSSVTEDLVENFILPRSTIIQPRRHRNVLSQSDAVNETFADLNVAGVLPTTEYVRNDVEHIHEPVQMIQPRRDHTHEQRIKEPDAFAFVPKKETTKTDFSDFASIKSQPQKVQPQPITLDEDITRLIKEDATDVGTIIEPGFSESSEDDLTITSETKKIILEGLNDKASKFKEKQREILATGPINPTKLMSHLENGNNIGSSILDEITSDAINENDDVTSAQLLGTSENPKDIINNSKIYGSFRRMSA
ncbi:hypothetical protein Zmor_011979 [Zophobas morio]|uniref:Uncharacterized protein n=1 Tax=Zophobas morio TaxID=2755281 RepID=A0AA38HJB4_9CUCU|nr:hypothetical protein Zmor_011979 [Zophobas morio]